jgi:hypothetical protein
MNEKDQFIEDFIEIPLREDAKKQFQVIVQIEVQKQLTKVMEELYGKEKKATT